MNDNNNEDTERRARRMALAALNETRRNEHLPTFNYIPAGWWEMFGDEWMELARHHENLPS